LLEVFLPSTGQPQPRKNWWFEFARHTPLWRNAGGLQARDMFGFRDITGGTAIIMNGYGGGGNSHRGGMPTGFVIDGYNGGMVGF
jgi:hypothetical protein